MKRSVLKQSFQWAIVTKAGKLALFDGRCPLYWRRKVAAAELAQWAGTKSGEFRIEKVTVLAVYR